MSSVPQETQTDNDFHPPDFPPKRDHESEPNFINHPNNSENIFLRDHSFPLITSAATTTTTTSAAPPPSGLGHRPARPVSDRGPHDLERRGSRSRLKAVSVDDSCQDRPRSWKGGSEVPDSKSMPVITGGDGDSAEAIEMDTLGPRPASSSSSPRLSQGEPRLSQGEPEGEQGDGGLPGFLSSFASPELMAVPVRLETQPRDNAHAQLKTPEEDSEAFLLPAVLPPDSSPEGSAGVPPPPPPPGRPGEPWAPGGGAEEPRPVNGVWEDWDSDGEGGPAEESLLPRLHISEEDLNGNVPKLDSFDSDFLPPPPARSASQEQPAASPPSSSSSPSSPPCRPNKLASPPGGLEPSPWEGGYSPPAGRSPDSEGSEEEDSAGLLPLTLSSTEASSSLTGGSPPGHAYAFDPCIDSDPNDFDEQFMHGSPKKGVGTYPATEDKQEYERRLRNVRTDQEAIPI